MTQSDFFEDAPVPCGFKAKDIGEYRYKIWDDSVGPRHFLGADHEDGIEAILLEREGHSLYEFTFMYHGNKKLRIIIYSQTFSHILKILTYIVKEGPLDDL